jgi:hypothetical protein
METKRGIWLPGPGWEEKFPKAIPVPRSQAGELSPRIEINDTGDRAVDQTEVDKFRRQLDEFGHENQN